MERLIVATGGRMIAAGKLNQRIEIIQVTAANDSAVGNLVETEWVYGSRWASVTPINSRESQNASGQQAITGYEVTLRLCEAIQHDWLAKWRGLTLKIESVLHDRNESETRLTCRTIETNG